MPIPVNFVQCADCGGWYKPEEGRVTAPRHAWKDPADYRCNCLRVFGSVEEAQEWMEAIVNDDCIDNFRFCFNDDPNACFRYEMKVTEGCCGFFDEDIMIGDRPAMIGCNFGH